MPPSVTGDIRLTAALLRLSGDTAAPSPVSSSDPAPCRYWWSIGGPAQLRSKRMSRSCLSTASRRTRTATSTGYASAMCTPVAILGRMTMDLKVLKCGKLRRAQARVHALALGVAALCGLYNAAAWMSRRERHLAINTVMYAALIAIEQQHVVAHIAEFRRPANAPELTTAETIADAAPRRRRRGGSQRPESQPDYRCRGGRR